MSNQRLTDAMNNENLSKLRDMRDAALSKIHPPIEEESPAEAIGGTLIVFAVTALICAWVMAGMPVVAS